MKMFVKSLFLAAAFTAAPSIVNGIAHADEVEDLSKLFHIDNPIVLPDSDTSSLTTKPEDLIPFNVVCTTAETFNKTLKRTGGKGMIVGNDIVDKALVMVFKFPDGSMLFARANWNGDKVCTFGRVGEPETDLGVILGNPKGGNG